MSYVSVFWAQFNATDISASLASANIRLAWLDVRVQYRTCRMKINSVTSLEHHIITSSQIRPLKINQE